LLQEENVEALTGLGLSFVQSKVFLALVRSDCATIKNISELSKVSRQDVYRVVSDLYELGLVKKMVSKPARFQAIAVENACAILLNRKKDECQKMELTKERFLRDFNGKKKPFSNGKDDQFFVVKGKEALLCSIRENFVRSRIKVDMATSQERFLQALSFLDVLFAKKLHQGVKVRVVTEKPNDVEAFLDRVDYFLQNSLFELRFVPHSLKANVTIFDNREALVTVQVGDALLKGPVLCTVNSVFLEMFCVYFDKMWNIGSPTKRDNCLKSGTFKNAF
jgi:sugar-specific transcriptional regulator TrmB